MDKQYFTKPGYRINSKPVRYRDSEEDALTYQVDVYTYAASIIRTRGIASVLDIGCGYGLKLRDIVAPLCDRIVGIDDAHAVEYCRRHHRFGRWFVDDIESPTLALAEQFDLIVSADVVEHLIDPDTLLTYIRRHSHPSTLAVLSTPERDRRRGPDSMGPPNNAAHVREWNRAEFACWLEDRGFEVVEHRIMDLKAGMATCQALLCHPAPRGDEPRSVQG